MADIVPASHNMWKYQWVTTETLSALPDAEFSAFLTESHRIVRATLPKRVQAELRMPGTAIIRTQADQGRTADVAWPTRTKPAGTRKLQASGTNDRP